MFKEVFAHIFATLVEKLMNAVDKKEENQIIIEDIKNNSNKITEQVYSKFVIQPAYKRGNLKDAVKIILEINELVKSDEVNNDWWKIKKLSDFKKNTYSKNIRKKNFTRF